MEIISSFFRLICSFVVDILYDKSIINNLFSFDLNKKKILIKDNREKMVLKDNNEIKTNENISQINQQALPLDNNSRNRKILIEDISNREIIDKNSEIILVNKYKRRNSMETNPYKIENEIQNFENQSVKNNLKDLYIKEPNMRINLDTIKQRDFIKEKDNNQLINYIKLNNHLIHLFFCFERNKNNVLIDKAMNIISEKLDILNLFRNICLQENFQKKFGNEHEAINMSEDYIKLLRESKIK